MSQKTMVNDLTTGNVTAKLLSFAMLLMMSNLLQTVYNMADMVVVGQLESQTGLRSPSIYGKNTIPFAPAGDCSASASSNE